MTLNETEELASKLIGQVLTDMQFFNVNDNYFVFSPKSQVVIDGGVVLTFNDYQLVIGWSEELELVVLTTNTIETVLGKLDFYQIPTDELLPDGIIGTAIISAQTTWNWYHDLDDDLEQIGEKQYIPYELVLQLEGEHSIQLASIAYRIENKNIHNPMYDSQGQLLVSIDKMVAISNDN
jgi:hypothetical protein